MGVIPAVQTFAKRQKIYPIALSASAWSDFYFSNQPSSPLINRVTEGLLASGRNAVEVPVELLSAYHHQSVDLPEGRRYWLPSFSARHD
jgi:hypothetical protein